MENKAKNFLRKAGKVTLPAMMLISGVWNANASISTCKTDLKKQPIQKKETVELNSAETTNEILVNSWNFDGECSGCEAQCGGCTGGCMGCTGGCTASCTGCLATCEGSSSAIGDIF